MRTLDTQDRFAWTFGRLLQWHLNRGTRPGGKTEFPGKWWNPKAFADEVGYRDRTVRQWLTDEQLPSDFETIERVLFGNDPCCYAEWRLELREAFTRSRTVKRLSRTANISTTRMAPLSSLD
jgi:hypothetical protein